jgi:hypothetical protein
VGGGLDKVSATTLSCPLLWRIFAVNSATKDRWQRCLSDLGSDYLATAPTSGLWSVKTAKFRPSTKC